jgi:hypothetical protein
MKIISTHKYIGPWNIAIRSFLVLITLFSTVTLFLPKLASAVQTPSLQISRSTVGGFDIKLFGSVGQSWRVLACTNLSNWLPIGTNTVASDGTALFHDARTGGRWYYRAQLLSSPSGNVITALSPSFTDVSNAVFQAKAGDTVKIPAGSGVWLNQSLVINKSITLKGAGTTSPNVTRLQNGNPDGSGVVTALIKVNLPADLPLRITGIFFDSVFNPILPGNGYQFPHKSAIRINGRDYNGNGVALTQVRVDHNVFNKGKMAVYWSGWAYGVTDHNSFTNADIAVGVWADDNFAWQREIKPGTSNAVFIEDNVFVINNNTDYEPNQQIYHQEGGRSTIRNNVFDGSTYTAGESLFIDSHGNWAGNPTTGYYGSNNATDARGQPMIEIYNNTFYSHQGYQFADFRGGSTLIYSNVFIHDSRPSHVIELTEEEAWQSLIFVPLRTVWPAEDQVNATFIWNNTCRFNGATARAMTISDISTSWNVGDSTFIQQGRDFWMKAPDATTCTTYPQVVNFPSTIVYPMRFTCITSYTPYVYPHPFVTGQN